MDDGLEPEHHRSVVLWKQTNLDNRMYTKVRASSLGEAEDLVFEGLGLQKLGAS